MKERCRHCNRPKVNRPRGLCWSCYYTPGVKEMYGTADPRKAKYASRSTIGRGFNSNAPLPAEPTAAPPGSLAKMKVMHARARRGEQLFHPRDNREKVADLLGSFVGRVWKRGDPTGLEVDDLPPEGEAA